MNDDWNELTAPVKKAAVIQAPVRLVLVKRNPRKTNKIEKPRGPARARLLLNMEVLRQLIPPSAVATAERVSIRLGKGERAHQMSVIQKTDGKFELKAMRNPWVHKQQGGVVTKSIVGVSIDLGIVAGWPDIDLPMMSLNYSVEKDAGKPVLVIDLPKLLWLNNPLRDAGTRNVK